MRENNKLPLRSLIVLLLFTMGLGASGYSMASVGEKEPENWNVLLIVLDDLNYHGAPLGGHPQSQTPHIDRLAQTGVSFTNAHSNVAVCNPSRASFMTGIAPTTSGCWGFVDWQKNEVLQQQLTLGEYAMKNGYLALKTGKVLHSRKPSMWDDLGIIDDYGPLAYDGNKPTIHPSAGKAHVAADLGTLDTTFVPLSDVPHVPPSADAPGFKGWHNLKRKGPFRYVNDEDRDLLTDELSAQWVADKLAQLEEDLDSKPFFMAMGIIRPHTPMVVPQKYFDQFPLEEIELAKILENDRADTAFPDQFGLSRGEKSFHGLMDSYPGDEGLRRFTQAYLASVAFADEMVGRALTALENSRFADNTVVILTSDHGWGLGEKDEAWKYTLWKESTHIPLIIRHPGYAGSAGQTVAHPVSLLDLFPTVKDFCGWQTDHRRTPEGLPLAGNSLRSFLEVPSTPPAGASEIAVSVIASWRSPLAANQHYSAVSSNYRYIRYYPEGEELYDLEADPLEWTNLAGNPAYAEAQANMRTKLDDWIQQMIAVAE
jgi:arylsulfatase A-like enzyme